MAETFDIDLEFYKAMVTVGGRRPVDINPIADRGPNADVVFEKENTILELKTLTEDAATSAAVKRRLNKLYGAWVAEGRMPPATGPVLISTKTLPRDLTVRLLEALAPPIRNLVTKANKQIKKTKLTLNMPTASGVLILANIGNPTLAPETVLNLLYHALGTQHTSITSGIFMTYGLPVKIEGLPTADVFAPFAREGFSPIDPELLVRIQDAG